MHPNDLLIDISGIPEDDLDDFAYDQYCELYAPNNRYGWLICHDNERAKIWESRFDHAFYTDPDHNSTAKTVLDKRRIECMQWIRPLVAGEMPNSQAWEIKRDDGYFKRLYIYTPENYAVWLEPDVPDNWFWFSTAFQHTANQLYRHTRRQKLLFKK